LQFSLPDSTILHHLTSPENSNSMISLRAHSAASLTAGAPSLLYEPEITIRRLYSSACDFRQVTSDLLSAAHHLSPHYSPVGAANRIVTSPNPELYLNLSKKSPILAAKLPGALHSSTPKKPSTEYGCSFCTFSCSWRYDLKLHLKQKHGIHKK
jgi:hypothetical protein